MPSWRLSQPSFPIRSERAPREPFSTSLLACYCNLTPGHRIPSLHSLPSSSRPATNAALNAMAHTAVVRAAQATVNCISTKHPPSLRRIAADTRAHCTCGFPSEGKTATPSQPSQPVRASQPANAAAQRFTASRADSCAIVAPPPSLVQ